MGRYVTEADSGIYIHFSMTRLTARQFVIEWILLTVPVFPDAASVRQYGR
jgi:hypothetical protein